MVSTTYLISPSPFFCLLCCPETHSDCLQTETWNQVWTFFPLRLALCPKPTNVNGIFAVNFKDFRIKQTLWDGHREVQHILKESWYALCCILIWVISPAAVLHGYQGETHFVHPRWSEGKAASKPVLYFGSNSKLHSGEFLFYDNHFHLSLAAVSITSDK